MKFRFFDVSIMQLIDKVTFLNGSLSAERSIILGDSCQLVSIQRMVQLMIAAKGKANIVYDGVTWESIIGNTKDLGRKVDTMLDGSSITHYVSILLT